jgi:hypothetical protein
VENELIAVQVPKEAISSSKYRALLPTSVRTNLVETAEKRADRVVALSREELLSMSEVIHDEQAFRGFDQNYDLDEYGRYLDVLIAAIETALLSEQ